MPPQQAPPANQGPTDNHMAAIWIVVGVFIVGFLIWEIAKDYIIIGFFYLKLFEIAILNFFTSDAGSLQNLVHHLLLAPSEVEFSQIKMVANGVGHFLYLPVIIIVAILSILLYFRSSTANYHHSYTMKNLLKAQRSLWPQVLLTLGKHLNKKSIEKGNWAMAMTPMQFAKCHQLLQENTLIKETPLQKQANITVSVIKSRAAEIFSLQLGPLWQGVTQLNPHTKALFAVFAARACRDEKASRELLATIARSAATNKLNFSGSHALLAKYSKDQRVVSVCNRHAYVLTVMASLLVSARSDGVLAAADFLWLKPIDRRLWFLLNTVGRQTAPAEIAGPFAHWLAEIELGRSIKTPFVDQAVLALESAVKEIIYHPKQG